MHGLMKNAEKQLKNSENARIIILTMRSAVNEEEYKNSAE